MRTAPQPPTSWERKKRQSDERRYQFLTYVFGGGVKVKDHEKHRDPVTPIRGASVRGQLRFWWRACNPSRCTTVEELRKREGEIWGTTSQASQVEIVVLTQPSAPRDIQIFEYNARHRLVPCAGMREIAYGAFPLQPSREAQEAGDRPWVLFDYGSSTFSLAFTYPEALRRDVEAALWAWENFGGLGGRTRRGFGAISRVGVHRTVRDVESELLKHQGNPRIAGVPSLHQARFAMESRSHSTSVEAWKVGLGLLQSIRQGRGFGRNHPLPHSQKPAGRSRWPEPDEIRRLTGQSAPLHGNPVVQVQRFPRAVFGMPIIFHFPPGSPAEAGSMGDPGMKPLQLQPVGFERFASPLIIRPIAEGTGFRASALALCSDVPQVEFTAGNAVHAVDWRLDHNLALRIPALNRNGQTYTDPIDLFLSEIKK
jgi:CRISPR-associated protein Cmr1